MLNIVIVEDNAALRESLVDVLAAEDTLISVNRLLRAKGLQYAGDRRH